jgi:hypothetical protein
LAAFEDGPAFVETRAGWQFDFEVAFAAENAIDEGTTEEGRAAWFLLKTYLLVEWRQNRLHHLVVKVLPLRTLAPREGNALVGTTKTAVGQLVQRALGRGGRDVWTAWRVGLEGVVVGEVDGDLLEGRLQVVEDLLVELRANLAGIEDGGERVGLVAPHKTIIFDFPNDHGHSAAATFSASMLMYKQVRIRVYLYTSIGSRMSRHEGRVDHLELLRTAYSTGKYVKRKDEQLVLDRDVRVSIRQPTAWVATQTNKTYNLGSLWLYLESATHRLSTYLDTLTELNLENVVVSDRKEIDAYFIHGNTRTPCISH